MCNLAEDKYKVAKYIRAVYTFSIPDISEKMNPETHPDAVYAVIGELLSMDLVQDTSEYMVLATNRISKVYQIAPDRRDELDHYIDELNKARLQPDMDGKPQGLNYRVLEQLVAELSKSKNSKANPENPDLLQLIERYLALVQLDELTNDPENPRENSLSEAYIRVLYGEYLFARQHWFGAVFQFLVSSQLFYNNNKRDDGRSMEAFACNVLVIEFQRLKGGKSKFLVRSLLDFARSIEKILERVFLHQLNLFTFTSEQILKQISDMIDHLSRHDGDFLTVLNSGWTYPSDNMLETQATILLNEARLCIMNNERVKARNYLGEAIKYIDRDSEHIQPTQYKLLRDTIEKHRVSLDFYLALDNIINGIKKQDYNEAQSVKLPAQEEYEGRYPFHIVDIFEKVKQAVSLLSQEDTYSQTGINIPAETDEAYSTFRETQNLSSKEDENFAYADWASWGINQPSIPFGILGSRTSRNLPGQLQFRDWLIGELHASQSLPFAPLPDVKTDVSDKPMYVQPILDQNEKNRERLEGLLSKPSFTEENQETVFPLRARKSTIQAIH